MKPKNKNKTLSAGGIILVAVFFFVYHANRNQQEAEARQRAAETLQKFKEQQQKWDGIQEKIANLPPIPNIPPPIASQPPRSNQGDRGRKFAAHQRRINNLPRNFGDGIVYVNCTYEERKNVLIFHYMLSFEFKGNLTQAGYTAIIKQSRYALDSPWISAAQESEMAGHHARCDRELEPASQLAASVGGTADRAKRKCDG